jgi:hypothetical protein
MAGSEPPGDRHPLLQRIGWFALLWLCGIAAVGLVAFLIRSVLL